MFHGEASALGLFRLVGSDLGEDPGPHETKEQKASENLTACSKVRDHTDRDQHDEDGSAPQLFAHGVSLRTLAVPSVVHVATGSS